MDTKTVSVQAGYRVIFRTWYTDKNGTRYAGSAIQSFLLETMLTCLLMFVI